MPQQVTGETGGVPTQTVSGKTKINADAVVDEDDLVICKKTGDVYIKYLKNDPESQLEIKSIIEKSERKKKCCYRCVSCTKSNLKSCIMWPFVKLYELIVYICVSIRNTLVYKIIGWICTGMCFLLAVLIIAAGPTMMGRAAEYSGNLIVDLNDHYNIVNITALLGGGNITESFPVVENPGETFDGVFTDGVNATAPPTIIPIVETTMTPTSFYATIDFAATKTNATFG